MNIDGYKIITELSYEKVSNVWVCKVKLTQSKKTSDGRWEDKAIEAVEISKSFNAVEESLTSAMASVTEYLSSVNGDLFSATEEKDETVDS